MIRKNIRLKEYNYASKGWYFITICAAEKACIFSEIIAKEEITEFKLKPLGKFVEERIKSIPEIYSNVVINQYVVMPNHVHMIMEVKEDFGITISRIIQQLKRTVTKSAGCLIWQKSFYEHCIRNEKEYLMIQKYILENPDRWRFDKYWVK